MKEVVFTSIITVILILVFCRLLVVFSDKIKFFTTGNDCGFKFAECIVLWKLAKMTGLEEPAALFVSVPTLNRAISSLLTEARRKGYENSPKIQNLLTKLYKFRTKIDIDHENKCGLESTKYLDKGQRLRVVFPGHKGVFSSEILNNSHEIIVKLPVQNGIATVFSEEWINHEISVYLWRKGDASYVFDTKVVNAGVFNGQTALFLSQTNELLRAQKRRSVRCECNLNASMYFIKQPVVDFNLVETEPGYRVVLEDISEDGAMIRVGGKGIANAQIKLQFMINDVLILMYGIVRAVEYNGEINQSRLHFECIHLDTGMRNAVLSFVYNVLPQDKKDIFDALSATEDEQSKDESLSDESEQDVAELEPVESETKSETENETEDSESQISDIRFDKSMESLDKLAEIDVN
ncbi:PilZ domain-containing protein [Treponema berlinense]|uniref:PilZ domain-containing protein n=1 Tax=Treponema berlinense TaxID=225004 RepID=UPI0023549AC7